MQDEELNLTARLAQAIASYEAGWKPVDNELYDLCWRQSSQDDFASVYTKVATIGRVYEAGVARAWRGEGDSETKVTCVLIEHADLIRSGLQRLENRSVLVPAGRRAGIQHRLELGDWTRTTRTTSSR